ncbi:hypothetical protein ES703_16008 [subsurface metagenome]
MANAEWEELKQALKKPATPEAMKGAAEAFERYRVVKLAKGKQSRPTLVSLKYKAPYPTAIELKDIPKELERNPAFFEFLKKVIK